MILLKVGQSFFTRHLLTTMIGRAKALTQEHLFRNSCLFDFFKLFSYLDFLENEASAPGFLNGQAKSQLFCNWRRKLLVLELPVWAKMT